MKKRILSTLMALSLCLSLLPTAARAAEPEEGPAEEPGAAVWTVTAFDALAEDVARQTLPQPAEGGETEGPNLPGTLTATAYQGEDSPQSVDVAVTWASEPDFDPAAPGEYICTPALTAGYALAEGVEPPTITVTVEAPPDLESAPPQDTPEEAPTVEDAPAAYDAGDTTASTWDGTADTSWYDSDAPQDAYTLTTAAQLAGLASLVNGGTDFSGTAITLGADIVLNTDGSSSNNWTPIGNLTNRFKGTFDGQGHTVTGLCITQTSAYPCADLFGCVDSGGTVKNLAVSGEVSATLVSSSAANPYAGGVAGCNYGTVEACSFSGSASASIISAGNSLTSGYAGGVVGGNYGAVNNCFHTGTVTGSGNSDQCFVYAGGVVGYSSKGSITNCYHIGAVTASGGRFNYAGGAVGGNYGTSSITNCYFLQEDGSPSNGVGYNSSSSGSSNAGAEPKTADAFVGGEVAYLLGLDAEENPDDTSPWRQNLGGADAAPVLDSTHARVVQLGDAYASASTGDDGKTYYLIYTAEQLQGFASAVNGGQTSINAKLMDDIDLSAVCGEGSASWTPIGSDSQKFTGAFDGQGHTVSELYVSITKNNTDAYAGLFGYVASGGVVKNLAVSGAVKSKVTVGAYDSAWSYTGGVAGYNEGTVEACSFSGSVSAALSSVIMSSSYTGGVVGGNTGGAVNNCFHTGTVTSSGDSWGCYVSAGGVAGSNNGGAVNNCYHTGSVTASGGNNHAGGVVGYGSMTNCYFLQEDGSSLSDASAAGKDADAFAGGEVAYLLQGEQADAVWVQALGEDGTWYPALLALLSDSDTYYTVRRAAFTAGEDTTYRYTNSQGQAAVPALPTGYVGWYLDDAKVEGSTITVLDLDIAVVAKTQASTPDVSINYGQETLNTTAAMEYRLGDDVAWTDCSESMKATDFGDWNGSAAVTVQFRAKAAGASLASDVKEVAIPARPAAPTGLQGVNETVDGNQDGKITGLAVGANYELSADGGTSWTAKTADGGGVISGLAQGTYQIHLAATDTAFAGAAADVEIARGADRTYTLNVAAPAFDSAAYGDAQPDAKAITISSAGNSVSTISGVALSGENAAAFTLNKTDGTTIQPGAVDTSTYTIRPAVGLDVGTYTATITVTYQEDKTATATVSFTVTPAAQAAPGAPAAKSRTYDSVTLETIEDNANGAKASYGISDDGGVTWNWQDSPAFTGLTSGATYTFAARYGAVGNYAASEPGPTAEIATSTRSSGGSSVSYYTVSAEDSAHGTYTVNPTRASYNSTVTITAKPDDGYKTGSVTVTMQNGRGLTVTDRGSNLYTFKMPAGSVSVKVSFVKSAEAAADPFADVPAGAYYYDAVKWAVENGVTAGTTAATFSPDAPCTRAQAVTFLWRAAGSPAPQNGANPFTDVQPGAYYHDAVLWAVENGVTAGTSATTFSPDQVCTRAQIVTFLWRAAGSPAAGGDLFADVADSAYYADAVKWAVAEGVTTGATAAAFSPNNACTRAQIVTFLYRAEA